MNLYPHNLAAYIEANRRFKKGVQRTCIIHPTGTGKSLIIAKFINDNPQKNHLLLAPSSYIFGEINKHVHSTKLYTSTLANLLYNYNEIAKIHYDFIYLDEFHRIGGDQWGKGVKKLLEENKAAKVLGTSATPIRFLDDHRNMASEIFDDNIASNISLNYAIVGGILKPPKYVAALYSLEPELKKLAIKIEKSNQPNKKILVEQLRRNIIDWELSNGLDLIVKKHLGEERNRIVVFCKDKKNIHIAEALLRPVFEKIFKEVEFFHVYSGYSNKTNSEALGRFSGESLSPKILFTVDMLNEGLHMKNVNTAILLRETASPTVFYQQIGRCFSAGQSHQPLIFDMVNNFKSIRISEFEREFREETHGNAEISKYKSGKLKAEKIGVEFIDETKEISELFRAFSNSIENWELMFKEAVEYQKANNHLHPPHTNYKLWHWVTNQRHNYKNAVLSEKRKELLDGIGMDWDYGVNSKWMSIFKEVESYIKVHNNEPQRKTNKRLYNWVFQQRMKDDEGKLNDEQSKLLNSLVSEKTFSDKNWERKLELLKEHKKQTGDFIFSTSHPLYNTTKYTRKAYKTNSIPPHVLEGLKEINFPFKKQKTWEEAFLELKQFMHKHHELPSHSSAFSFLYRWILEQRVRYKNNKLAPKQITLLKSINIL